MNEHNVTDQRAFTIPLKAGRWVTISADWPLDEEQWTDLMTILHVMKPGLVTPQFDADAQFEADIRARRDAAMRPLFDTGRPESEPTSQASAPNA